MRENSIFKEIKSDYTMEDFDYEGQRLRHLDGFRTEDENEEGSVLATVDEDGKIDIKVPEAENDPYFKEVLAEVLAETFKAKQELVDKAVERIKKDIAEGDVTALEVLLNSCPSKDIEEYL